VDEHESEARLIAKVLGELSDDVLSQLDEESRLDIDDRDALVRGVEATQPTLSGLVKRLCADWDTLSVAERIAGLVAVACIIQSVDANARNDVMAEAT
jgi:hypothetical protein